MRKFYLFIFLLLSSVVTFGQCAGDIEITSFSPNPYPDQTFPPNTSVDVCITMNGWTQVTANWVEGFDLTLGEGWVDVQPLTPPADSDLPTGNWLWMDNVTSSVTLITAGPGYFFEETMGGGGGVVDGNPGNDWGDNCSIDCSWSFCITLTTSNVVGQSLDIGVTALGDGTIGGYSGGDVCNNPLDYVWTGEVGQCPIGCTDPDACNYNPNAGCEDGSCSYFTMGAITHNLINCPDTVCTGLNLTYSVNGSQSSTYNWFISGGGTIDDNQDASAMVTWGNTPGVYTISVQEVTSAGCLGELETCDVEVVVPDITFDSSYRICYNQFVELSASPVGGVWSGEYVNGNIFYGNSPGVFWPSYTQNIFGCDVTESIDVIVEPIYQSPQINYTKLNLDLCTDLQEQLYIADDDRTETFVWTIDNVLQLTNDNILSVTWYDTTNTYLINVYGIDNLGCRSDVYGVNIHTESCQVFYAPNTFTPNGDGVNDVFKITSWGIYETKLKIFNRWGVIIHESPHLWWTGDGGSGYFSDNDIYTWIVEYKDRDGFRKTEQGIVTLIR